HALHRHRQRRFRRHERITAEFLDTLQRLCGREGLVFYAVVHLYNHVSLAGLPAFWRTPPNSIGSPTLAISRNDSLYLFVGASKRPVISVISPREAQTSGSMASCSASGACGPAAKSTTNFLPSPCGASPLRVEMTYASRRLDGGGPQESQ